MIDLTQFCGEAGLRYQIEAPISDADYTYATNGHILIRVLRRPEIAEAPFAENCAKLFAQFATGDNRQWFAIPELPAPIMKEEFEDDEDEDGYPIKGRSLGMVEQPQSVDVGNCLYARKYLAMIAALPAATISTNGKNGAWFKFDGGDGLLMPMTRKMP